MLGRSGRRQQTELTLASLSDHDEGGCGDEGDEQHRHGRGDQHADRRKGLLALATLLDVPARWSRVRAEVVHPVFVGADQDHVGVRRDLRGRSGEYELLIEVVRILHLADDGRLLAVEFDGVTDRNAEQLCRPIGQGNLVGVAPDTARREPQAWQR